MRNDPPESNDEWGMAGMGGTLDADTARRLLEHLEPDDAPPGYAAVARVLRTAAHVTDDDEADAVSEFRAMAQALAAAAAEDSSRMPRTRRAFKAVVGAVGGLVLLTGGMATAGALPAPAQDLAAAALSSVGIDVPDGASDSTPDESGPEGTDTNSSSSDHGKGADISSLATTTDATGADKGATISDAASNGKSHAGDPKPSSGQPGDAPQSDPASTPGTPASLPDPASPPSQGKSTEHRP